MGAAAATLTETCDLCEKQSVWVDDLEMAYFCEDHQP